MCGYYSEAFPANNCLPVMGRKLQTNKDCQSGAEKELLVLFLLHVIILRRIVNNPKRLSSSKYKLILRHPLTSNFT